MIGLDHYVGEVLDDKYRLERLLGQGGMGAVYLAVHLGTERYVALKLITPQFMRNEEFVQRFKREARAAGRLRHPNVVDVTDFGFARASGEPVAYLVMEYLDGCTLGDVLSEEKRLPLEWVVDILEQVCSAVHEAHQQGVVHRDLKPENIWLEPNRLGGYRVKVLDFGIAKLGSTEATSSGATDSVQPPRAGALSSTEELEKGTLLYNANETAPDIGRTGRLGDQATSNKATSNQAGIDAPGDRASATQFHSSNATLAMGAAPGATTIGNDVELDPDEENATQLFASPAAAAPSASAGASDKRTSVGLASGDGATALFAQADEDDGKTLHLDQATRAHGFSGISAAITQTTQLTRVGAIMGTPLYMSPEQCAAKHLDARSDIYSLGVIAYQMLSGEPPFAGNTSSVMKGHIELAPTPLRERVKVPKRAARVVMSALAKDPAQRPQTAAAFANTLRAEADGIGTLYRRAFALYFEHFPKFFRMSLLAHIPVIISTLLLIGIELTEKYVTLGPGITAGKVLFIVAVVVVALMQVCSYFVAAAAISGMTAVIVTQLSVAPLRPMELNTAFAVIRKRWRAFLRTSLRVTIRQIIGFILLVIPGFIVSVRYMLYAPVVLMEGLEKKAALKRARELASRSWRTVIIIVLLQFLVPIVVSTLMGQIGVSTNTKGELHVSNRSMAHQIYQQLSGLINIFVVPLASIVSALLYLKMRQLGGETLSAALDQIEDINVDRSQWQKRMRSRLQVSAARSSSHASVANTPSSSKPGSAT
jgi:serine/threonine protein kinase